MNLDRCILVHCKCMWQVNLVKKSAHNVFILVRQMLLKVEFHLFTL